MAAVGRRQAEKTARLFALLADSSRYMILSTVSNRGGANVQSICERAGMTQSAVSHQLQKLHTLGVVKSKKEGRMVVYTLATTPIGRQVARLLRFK